MYALSLLNIMVIGIKKWQSAYFALYLPNLKRERVLLTYSPQRFPMAFVVQIKI